MAIGAIIVTGHSMIEGWKLHRMLLRRAPALAPFLPPDAGALAGFFVGIGLSALIFGG
ncbi:MAG: hypothetical protein AB7F39_06520 [Variibacter sp.]